MAVAAKISRRLPLPRLYCILSRLGGGPQISACIRRRGKMRTFISYDHVGDSRVDLATIVRAVSVPTVKLLTSPPVNFISRLTAQFRDINMARTARAFACVKRRGRLSKFV
jgi:hypothetical protein